MPISSPFNPSSPQAQAISNLFILTLVIGTAITLLILGLVLYASFRYRSRPGQGEPRQVFGHRQLEIGWTLAPALVLAWLLALTINTMRIADPPVQPASGLGADPPAQQSQPDLVVVAQQWWWTVRYPQAEVVTANEIHIPVGKRLLMRLESDDVIHDFWVPQVGRKMDATPGHPVLLWIEVDRPGTYLGACSEYCGVQHAWMRLRVMAQPQGEFDAWLAQQQQVPAAPAGGETARGAQLFQDKTCVNCHAIAGTQAEARVGPDLTHVASRETLGAGVLENTEANMARWLKDPQAVKPGNHMPDMRLTDAEVRALTAYLETLK
ncbi:MAG: cytochrome c oxidase subunit II [Ardenticatenaceae bacterium]|nr:cytochrome c oxidase subunit II [Ardenticatenaceae bacterium]HBY95973.1 cytochrome c oxidase subunit II [Chloroflexota bacterium]